MPAWPDPRRKLGAARVRWRLQSYEDFGAWRGLWAGALYARLGNQEVRVQEHELSAIRPRSSRTRRSEYRPLGELVRQSEPNLDQRLANHGMDSGGYGSAYARIFLPKEGQGESLFQARCTQNLTAKVSSL
jgi:hypothetical protein